jgi:hypothetical protein
LRRRTFDRLNHASSRVLINLPELVQILMADVVRLQ